MHCAKLVILALGIGVGPVAFAQSPTPRANLAAGRDLFRQNCSICHGQDAKGYLSKNSGSMYDPNSADESRRVPPADLTALSEHNAGKFPADRVREALYNKGAIPAHGSPDMPAWGHAFDNLKYNPKRLEQRMRDLTAYIDSIQETSK